MSVEIDPTRVLIPTVNKNDGHPGISRLLSTMSIVWDCPDPIILDLSRCRFASAEAGVMIASLKLFRDARGFETSIDFTTLGQDIRRQLILWQVARLFGVSCTTESRYAIPILHQPELDEKELVKYVADKVVCRMPQMSDTLAKITRCEICELFNNIFQHSNSDFGGIVLGQVYPRVKEFQLCVCDGGRGLVNRVQSAGFGTESSLAAIEWALCEGNSTTVGGMPSGLGLSWLRQLIETNKGRFTIYANGGYFCQNPQQNGGGELAYEFRGTLVDFRFNLDGLHYELRYC